MKTPRAQGEKSAASRSSKRKTPAATVLQRLALAELAAVLKTLLGRHPDLKDEAEEIAVELLSSPSADDVADEVFSAVTSLGIESFHGRAGKQPWGYVEPSQAAWDLLHEAVEEVLDDMRRRLDLGLDESALAICRGVVTGLHRAKGAGSDGPLGWAPDFPAEEACHAVAELIHSCPKERRRTLRDRLLEAIDESAPDWSEMIARAAEHATQGK